jgi:hypothetical protein
MLISCIILDCYHVAGWHLRTADPVPLAYMLTKATGDVCMHDRLPFIVTTVTRIIMVK